MSQRQPDTVGTRQIGFLLFQLAVITTTASSIHLSNLHNRLQTTAFVSIPTKKSFVVRTPHTHPLHSTTAEEENEEVIDSVIILADTDEDEASVDWTLGGVGIAKDCAVQIAGNILVDGQQQSRVNANRLIRYNQMKELSESEVLNNGGYLTIVCTGEGKEFYKDPGESTVKEVKYAPTEAVLDALKKRKGGWEDAKTIVFNFLGGDDLIWGQVQDACVLLVQELGLGSDIDIEFHSVCFKDFPLEQTSVAVVALNGKDGDDELLGLAKSLSMGELYFQGGKWHTVLEEDINSSVL